MTARTHEAKHVVVITAADGTVSVTGPFRTRDLADQWGARLELRSDGELSGQPVELEVPRDVMAAITAANPVQ